MNPSFIKFRLALAIGLSALCTAPGFAQDGDAPAAQQEAAPAPAVEAPMTPAEQDLSRSNFAAKGPMPFQIDKFGRKGQRKKLALVTRGWVAGNNTGLAVGGIAAAFLGVPGPGLGGINKEDFFGTETSAGQHADRLANPLLDDIPAAIDQNVLAMVADDAELGAINYKEPLHLEAGPWILVYDEMLSDSDKFYLLFRAKFEKRWEGVSHTIFKPKRANSSYCEYKSALKPLSVWQANDYEAVVPEKKKAADACIKSITAHLALMLGTDSDSKIRAAKLNCKTGYSQCVAESDKLPDADERKKLCKVEQKQCVSDEVKPLVDMTPLGQCKVTLVACKASVTEKFLATSPDGKPGRAEFAECAAEYKKCAEANKKQRSFLPPIF